MRLEYLREFIVAATYLNFTTAAKKLYMSQPKMSAHIAAMEDELGFKLFDRSNGITLSHEGKRFFEGSSRLVDDYDALVNECRKAGSEHSQHLIMGEFSLFEMFPESALNRYSRAIAELVRQHPALDISAVPIDNNLRISDYFEKELCDISFRTCCLPKICNEVIELDDGMSALPLEMDNMVAWISVDHPLARQDAIKVADLEEYPILLASCQSMHTWTTTRKDFMAAHGLTPLFATKSASTPSSFIAPLENNDVYLISEAFSHSHRVRSFANMTVRPLSDTKAQSCFCLCFPTETDNPFVFKLVDTLKSMAEQEAQRA